MRVGPGAGANAQPTGLDWRHHRREGRQAALRYVHRSRYRYSKDHTGKQQAGKMYQNRACQRPPKKQRKKEKGHKQNDQYAQNASNVKSQPTEHHTHRPQRNEPDPRNAASTQMHLCPRIEETNKTLTDKRTSTQAQTHIVPTIIQDNRADPVAM